MCRSEKKIIIRVFFTIFLLPLFMLMFISLEGANLNEALNSCFNVVFHFPGSLFSWFLVLLVDMMALMYMRPIFSFWGKYNKGNEVSLKDRNKAMNTFNTLGKFIALVTTFGFIVGPILSIGMELDFRFKFVSNFYIILENIVTGLFTASLINMTLNNILFKVKSALMLNPPTVRPKYLSFYKQLITIILLLLAFLGFRVFLITAEFFDIAIKMGGAAIKDSLDMNSVIRPEELFTRMGKSHEFIEDLVEVMYFKLLIFMIFTFRALSLIKKSIKNPLNTVENRLDSLSSDNHGDIGSEIAIVNNDEFSNIYRDINKLIKKQETELKLSQNRLHSIIDSAADPIVSFNEKGYIFIFNPAAENFFGWKREEIKGKSLVTLFDPNADVCRQCGSDDRRFIKSITDEDNPLQRFVGLTSSKQKVSFEANFSKNETPDGVIYTAIIRDISKQMEFENTLKEAKVSAERANTLKSEFLANMSHELRTPLNAVLGFTQLLSNDKNLTDTQVDKINIISRSGEHLLGLINDILDISKIEAGKIEIHDTSFNLREFTEDIKQMFELKCKKKGLTLYVEYVDPIPEYVIGDLGKIRQILINIIGNAVKFTSEGGISVVVGMKPDGLRFSINDTGKGIPEDEISSILKPFTQSSMIDNEGGTGLGLAITNSFINMMGGELSIESQIDVGSTFSFTLDVEEGEKEVIKETGIGEVLGIKGSLHPKILVVDDKLTNRLILKEMLERVGFVTMEAENGKIAIERSLEFKPDLIFMDIKMPVLDGYGAVKELKSDDRTKAIPVFALTASAFKHNEQSILDSGFDGFLAKPFKQSSLFNLISNNTIIEFIYQETVSSKEEISIDSLDVKSISSLIDNDLLEGLDDLILINDFAGIKKLIDSIEVRNGIDEFLTLVEKLANDFDDENLEALIEKVKENK